MDGDRNNTKKERHRLCFYCLWDAFFFGSLSSFQVFERSISLVFSKVLAPLADRVKFSVLPLDGTGGIELRVLDDSL